MSNKLIKDKQLLNDLKCYLTNTRGQLVEQLGEKWDQEWRKEVEKRNHPQSRSFAYSFKRSRNTNLKSKKLIKGAFELPLPVSLPAKYEGRMNYF